MLWRPTEHLTRPFMSSTLLAMSRHHSAGLNTNNSNSSQRGTPILLPDKPSKHSRTFYTGYGGLSKSKETQRRGLASKPPPTYQPPPVIGGHHHRSGGSIPSSPRERRRESRPGSRPSSPHHPLPRSLSSDRINTLTRDTEFFTTREGQRSRGSSQYSGVSRDRSHVTDHTYRALTDQQYGRELTATEKQARERGKSPELRRSNSISGEHPFGGSSKHSEQKVQPPLLTARHSTEKSMFPTSFSSTYSPEPPTPSSRSNRAFYDRAGTEPPNDAGRYSPLLASPRPGSRTSPSGSNSGGRSLTSSPVVPRHTSPPGQSSSRNTSTGSVATSRPYLQSHTQIHSVGSTSLTGSATVSSPPPYSPSPTHCTGNTSTDYSTTRGPPAYSSATTQDPKSRTTPSPNEDLTHSSTKSVPLTTSSSASQDDQNGKSGLQWNLRTRNTI